MRDQVVTAKAGFICETSSRFPLDPKQPLTSGNRNSYLGFASGQRPLSYIENPQSDDMVVCCLRLFLHLTVARFEEGSQQARGEMLPSALPALLGPFLGSSILVHIDFSNIAISLIYKTP